MSDNTASVPNVPTKQPAPGENRVWVRYGCPPDTPGQLFDTESSKVQQGAVHNLSSGGIGLLLGEPIQLGTIVKVELDGWSGPRMLTARVTHTTEQPDGWLHGCELELPLSGCQVRDLLADTGDDVCAGND
jgi:hypothetical protein